LKGEDMCENYSFNVNYYDGENIKADLFSDEAEKIVKCFLKNNLEQDYRQKRGKNQLVKKLSSTQIRKFYEEVLNLKAMIDNGKEFREILPYFRMLKAKANVAYERDVINTSFKIFIEKNVDYVGESKNRFKIFCTFFEAVVAYAKGTIKD
jgi:CRISPR type III-A-associated protein Csm2